MPQALIERAVATAAAPARAGHRAAVEDMLRRAQKLDPADRALIEHVLRDGRRAAELAPLLGVHKRTAQRRVNRLLDRLQDPVFQAACDRLAQLPPPIRAVAEHHICRGRTLRDTARRTGQSLHRVRVHLERLRQFAADTQSLPDLTDDTARLAELQRRLDALRDTDRFT